MALPTACVAVSSRDISHLKACLQVTHHRIKYVNADKVRLCQSLMEEFGRGVGLVSAPVRSRYLSYNTTVGGIRTRLARCQQNLAMTSLHWVEFLISVRLRLLLVCNKLTDPIGWSLNQTWLEQTAAERLLSAAVCCHSISIIWLQKAFFTCALDTFRKRENK